jgi:hypothetical protein
MQPLFLRNLTISVALSLLAEAATVILFTRRLSLDESASLGTTHGFAGTSLPQPAEGFQLLLHLVSEPAFGAPILVPQLLLYFVFLWAATTLATRNSRGVRRGAVV